MARGLLVRRAVALAAAFGLVGSLAACVGSSASGRPSALVLASAHEPSATAAGSASPSPSPWGTPGSPAISTRTATAVATATPTPTPDGGMSWQAAGSKWFGGIIGVPNGYLASCGGSDAGEPAGLCSSRDLLTWQAPPDPALYVSTGGAELEPGLPIPVKSGYGVRAGGNDPQRPEWYSADGVHWQEGIPANQVVAGTHGPCVPDPDAQYPCVGLEFAVSDPHSPVAMAGIDRMVGNAIYTHILVSKDGWATSKEVTLPSPLWQMVYGDPQLLADGTWVAICSVMPPPPPPGMAYGGDPQTALISTKDGLHWQTVYSEHSLESLAVSGSAIFAVMGSGGGSVGESLDGGRTWLPMVDGSGEAVGGSIVLVVKGHVLVFEGWSQGSPGNLRWIGTAAGS